MASSINNESSSNKKYYRCIPFNACGILIYKHITDTIHPSTKRKRRCCLAGKRDDLDARLVSQMCILSQESRDQIPSPPISRNWYIYPKEKEEGNPQRASVIHDLFHLFAGESSSTGFS